MKSFSRTLGRFSLWCLVGVTAGILPAQAQNTGISIFRGDPKATSGIQAGGWGSGTVEEDAAVHISGTHSYKVTTQGFYQGASLRLSKPANLGSYVNNKNAFLQFAIRIVENGKGTTRRGGASSFPGGSGFPGAGGAGQTGGFPGGFAGGFPGGAGGRGGGPGGRQNEKTKYQEAKEIENVRVQLVNAQDDAMEFLLPVAQASDADGWNLMNIPVSAIPGIKSDNAEIKEIRIFGDQPGLMYVGSIRVLIDATPITADRIEDKLALPRSAKTTLRVRAAAGVAPLKVTWDFDENDGIQEEKEGRAISHSFYKSGVFIVTVTVSDVYGVRQPVVRRFKVNVTP